MPFIAVLNNPNRIIVQPHSINEVGTYKNLRVKAVSTLNPNITLLSNTFQVELLSTAIYPYFNQSINHLKVFQGQRTTYTFPQLNNIQNGIYNITLSSGQNIPSFISYSTQTQTITLNAPENVKVDKYDLKFNLNFQQVIYAGSFYGTNIIDIENFNQNLYLSVYTISMLPLINITVQNITQSNRITLNFQGANYINLKDNELDFKFRSYFKVQMSGNQTFYNFRLLFVSMNTQKLVFDFGLVNQQVQNGDTLTITFINDKFLMNTVNYYKVGTLGPFEIELQAPIIPNTTANSTNDTAGQVDMAAALQSVQAIGGAASSSTSSLIGLSTLLNLLSGASLSFLWSLINAVQMYEFMPLAQVNTPEFVYAMILKFSIAKFDFIPKQDIMNTYFNTSQCGEPFMENFAESNYQSTNFFFNQADILIILAIMFLYFVVALVLHFIFKNKTLYFKRSLEGFRYNAFIRLVTEDYLPIIVPCLITLKKFNTTNSFEVASIGFAAFFLISFLSIAMISSTIMVMRFFEINHDKQFYLRRVGCLFEELKTSRRFYLLYHPFFYLNRTIIAFDLIFMTDNFFVQIWIMIICQFFFTVYLIVFRPFKERKKNIMEIFNEVCIFCSSCILFAFSQLDEESVLMFRFGWFFLAILIFNVAVNVVKGLVESLCGTIKKLKRLWIRKCMKKADIHSLKASIEESFKIKFDKLQQHTLQKDKLQDADDVNDYTNIKDDIDLNQTKNQHRIHNSSMIPIMDFQGNLIKPGSNIQSNFPNYKNNNNSRLLSPFTSFTPVSHDSQRSKLPVNKIHSTTQRSSQDAASGDSKHFDLGVMANQMMKTEEIDFDRNYRGNGSNNKQKIDTKPQSIAESLRIQKQKDAMAMILQRNLMRQLQVPKMSHQLQQLALPQESHLLKPVKSNQQLPEVRLKNSFYKKQIYSALDDSQNAGENLKGRVPTHQTNESINSNISVIT